MLTVFLALQALAVAPTDHQGSEPVRVRVTTPQGQAAFARGASWEAFVAGEGKGFRVRADERAGTPFRMWGGLPLVDENADEAAVDEALQAFTERHAELLGVREHLPLTALGYDPDFETWYASYGALREGVPIWRAELTYRVKFGNLVLAGADTYPNTPTRGGFALGEARAIAIAHGVIPGTHTDGPVTAYWLPRVERGLLVLRAVYEVRSHTDSPLGDWVAFVDGESGEVLAHYNDIRFLTGTLTATYDNRFPGNGTLTGPVKGGVVNNGTTAVLTGANGSFNVPNGPSYQAHFRSNPIDLSDDLGDVGLSFTNSTPNWTAQNGSIAAIDTFVFLNQVRDSFNLTVPSETWTTGNLTGTVNLNDTCNAYYDGTVNFFRSGNGCSNTGRLADVVYHEWGHGFHAERIISGSFDGALSEGAGDVTGFLMTGDSALAPGFFTQGGALRNADNTRRYPDDLVDQVHEDGLIFAGAMWDTRESLVAALGETAGNDVMKELLSGMLTGGPDLASSIDEALLADDNDGNLANGTPHSCHIEPAFALHGLGQGGSAVGFTASQDPAPLVEAGRAIPIEVEVVGPVGCASGFDGGTSRVHYRVDNGLWTEAPLVVNGPDITGSIPSQPSGTFVEYYVTVDGAGQSLASPSGAWRSPFSLYVGNVIEVHCDDFEGSDGGYTHALLAGQPGDGADDWQHGAPNGRAGDPQVAHSGNNVWGNDLGFDDFNGAYQSGKTNRLTGPVVELGHYEGALLHYWRWLTIEDGTYDRASIFAGEERVWENVVGAGQDHHTEDQWAPHAVDLGNPSGSVQVAFQLQSDAGLEFGGWTVDDVCVYVPATANNRLGVTDFSAGEGGEGTVALSWTNPVHAPLASVRVVRGRGGACPTSEADGDVVFVDDTPGLGAPVTAADAVPTTDTYCYAVFPGDGSASLGWVVEGWNADTGSAAVAATEEQIEEQQEENGVTPPLRSLQGCACTSLNRAAWWGVLPLAALLIRRRRG